MVTKIRISFFVAVVLFFANCSQFQDVFDAKGKTSYQASKQSKQSKQTANDVNLDVSGGRTPIVTKKGTYYFVVPGDTLSDIAQKYRISTEDLAQINDLYDSTLVIGRRLFIPNKKSRRDYLAITNIFRQEKAAKVLSQKKVEFIWPVEKFVLFSKFGKRRGRPHDGLDLSTPTGTPIYAAAAGKVIYSKRFAGYGNLLVLKHANQFFTAYAHTQEVFVSQGKSVKQGDKIATVGRTGRTTGPHLHFEVRKGTDAIDPLTVLPERR